MWVGSLHISDSALWGIVPGRPVSSLPSIKELAKYFHSQGSEGTSFIDLLKSKFTDQVITAIFEKKTKKQYLCPLWKEQRIGAITSSIIHKAARYKKDDSNNYIVKEIMGQSSFTGNSATFYGQKYETLARKLYEMQMRKNHQGFEVKCAGLIVCKNCPLIRASRDGIASCSCCGTGIIEIKCPARPQYQTMTGEEIARDGSYHLKLEHNRIQLKKESQWYTQIQTARCQQLFLV